MHQRDLDQLELLGQAGVLQAIARGGYGQPGSELREEVEAWLRLKELERANSIASSAAAMDREALRIAASAKKIAIAQIVVSTITAVVVSLIGLFLSK